MANPSNSSSTLFDPFGRAHAAPNIKSLILVTLDIKYPNYEQWSKIFNLTAGRFSLTDLLHGKPRPPNISIQDWQRADFLLQSWIYSTISNELRNMIPSGNASAHDRWTFLASVFDNLATQLKEQFQSLKLGSRNIYEYCGAVKTVADKLAGAGHPVSDEEIVLQALRGLPKQYETFANFISGQDPLPSFSQIPSLLCMEEIRFNRKLSQEWNEKLQRGKDHDQP